LPDVNNDCNEFRGSNADLRMGTPSTEPRSEPAIELAVLLRNELSALLQEDVALASLIRSFKDALRKLNRSSRQLSTNSFSGTSLADEKFEKQTKPRYSRDDSSYALRRACRIALMESDEAATAQEICARILRRGSYAFESGDNAFTVIEQTLSAMQKEGEALATNSLPRQWKRGLNESASPDTLQREKARKQWAGRTARPKVTSLGLKR
jgi:hypothetical protein